MTSPIASRCLKNSLALLASSMFCTVAMGSAAEERLSLRSVILKALENNNDIMIEDLGRLVEAEKIKVASQALNPRFEGSYVFQSIRTPQNTQDYIATGGGIVPDGGRTRRRKRRGRKQDEACRQFYLLRAAGVNHVDFLKRQYLDLIQLSP